MSVECVIVWKRKGKKAMKNEEQERSLFGISLSTRPKWQQFLICSSGFFFGYLVNGICEVFTLSGIWSYLWFLWEKNNNEWFLNFWWMRKRKRVGKKKEIKFLHFSVFLQNCAGFFFFFFWDLIWLVFSCLVLRKWEWNLERKWSLVDSFYFFLLILFYCYYSLNLCSVSLRTKWIVFEKLFSLMVK